MKTLKFSILAILMALFIQTSLQGQGSGSKAHRHFNAMLEQIPDLSPEQKEAMVGWHNELIDKMEALRNHADLSPSEIRMEMGRLHDEFGQSVKNILSEAQNESFALNFGSKRSDFSAPHHGGQKLAKGVNHEALRNFIMQQRLAFDRELTQAERDQIAAVHAQIENKRQDCDRWGGMQPSAQRGERKMPGQTQMEPLRQIADTHAESLQQIHESIDAWISQNRTDLCPANPQRLKNGINGRFAQHRELHFLLMNTENLPADPVEPTNDFELFPNPVKNTFSIRFQVPAEGLVTIDLLGRDGDLKESILSEVFSAGEQMLEINARGYKNNEVYFIRIQMPGQVLVKKFIKTAE